MTPPIAAIRALIPCLEREAYLNTGGAGPMAEPVAEAVRDALAVQLARGRMGLPSIEDARHEQDLLRAALTRVAGGTPDEIAVLPSVTHAMNAVIWGIDLREGDEVVTTSLEHPSLAVPLAVAARRRGARLRVVPLEDGSEPLEELIGAATGPRTRLVALSHVAYGTGAVLDVAGAARAARACGALVLVDGAQSAGAIPVDVAALGADAYAFPAQKWLMGPEGLGALRVGQDALARIDLTVAGYDSGTDHGLDGSLVPHPGARRLESASYATLLVPAWRAALEWLGGLGWEWIHERTRAAAGACRRMLERLPGVRLVTPAGPQAGLVTFTVDGAAPEEVWDALAAAGVTVRPLPHPRAVRASCAFFTVTEDLDRLGSGVAGVASCYRARP